MFVRNIFNPFFCSLYALKQLKTGKPAFGSGKSSKGSIFCEMGQARLEGGSSAADESFYVLRRDGNGIHSSACLAFLETEAFHGR
jgi:hypothetical protein